MNNADSLAMRTALRASPASSIVPMLPMFLSLRERDSIDAPIVATVVIWIDRFFKPLGILTLYGMFEHALGTLVLRAVRPESIYDKPAWEGGIGAETI